MGVQRRFRVAHLHGLEYQEAHGPDVSDWLAGGKRVEQLVEVVAATPDYKPQQSKSTGLRVVNFGELLNLNIPKRLEILSPFLLTQSLCMLYAMRGVGKTYVALGMAYAVATGGSFLRWHAPLPKKVLYIDGEMPIFEMQDRLQRISLGADKPLPDSDYFRLITPDLQRGSMPDFATRVGRESLDAFIDDCDLVIIDNISSCFRSGVENEAESWQPVQDWGLDLRRRGKSVLLVHHAGKGGQQRGTSKREDILDAVINLRRSKNYKPDQGAHFEVHYEKNRHFFGKEADPFQAHLRMNLEDGLLDWEVSDPAVDESVLEVVELKKEKFTIKEITEHTGLSKSKVETRLKKSKQQGLLE